MTRPSTRVRVDDVSAVGEARRIATGLADDLGLDETLRGKVAIVASEAASNVARHGGGGALVLRAVDDASGKFLEVLAIDHGQGIANLELALRDGFSTGGTAGTGLGAIDRISFLFDVWTAPRQGTVLVARVGVQRVAPLELGAVSLAAPGESVCGDGYAVHVEGATVRLVVVDGLGHGHGAHAAADAAIETFHRTVRRSPEDVVDETHGALRATRGAAIGVADIDLVLRKLRFVGVGNIAGATIAPGGRRHSVVSHNGIVGHNVRRIVGFDYELPPDGLVVFHSDGLATSWDIAHYPGLQQRHPAVIAGVLLRDFTRGRDDVTVVVVRDRATSQPAEAVK